MLRFELLQSSHDEGGKTYNKGDVFDSPHDLAKLFGADKFRLVGNQTPKAKKEDDADEDEHTEEEKTPAKKKKGKKKEETTKEETNEAGEGDGFGEDVTADLFPKCPETLLVFQNEEGAFTVVDKNAPEVALNGEPLKTAKEVKAFLNNHKDG